MHTTKLQDVFYINNDITERTIKELDHFVWAVAP